MYWQIIYVSISMELLFFKNCQSCCLIGNQLKNLCIKKSINLFAAPAKDQLAISLAERLISTKKQCLGCIKEAHKEPNSFIIKAALKTILYQLCICKHKNTGISSWESDFDCRANTPLSNFSTAPKYSNVSFDRILNHYLDNETVIPDELLSEEHCVHIAMRRKWIVICAMQRNRDRQENETPIITSLASSDPQNCIKQFPSKSQHSE